MPLRPYALLAMAWLAAAAPADVGSCPAGGASCLPPAQRGDTTSSLIQHRTVTERLEAGWDPYDEAPEARSDPNPWCTEERLKDTNKMKEYVQEACGGGAGPGRNLLASASGKFQGCRYASDAETPDNEKPGTDGDHWYEIPLWEAPAKVSGKLYTTRMPRGMDAQWEEANPRCGETDPNPDRQKLKDKVCDKGLKNVLALVEDSEPPHGKSGHLFEWYQMLGLTVLRVPSADFDIPALVPFEAAIEFMTLALHQGRSTLIHCWGGSGRTGTFAIGVFKNLGAQYPVDRARLYPGKSVYLDVREQELFLKQMPLLVGDKIREHAPELAREMEARPLGPTTRNEEPRGEHTGRARVRLLAPAGDSEPGSWKRWDDRVNRMQTCKDKVAVPVENPDPWECAEEADMFHQNPVTVPDHSELLPRLGWFAGRGLREREPAADVTDFTGFGDEWPAGHHAGHHATDTPDFPADLHQRKANHTA